MFSKFLNWQFYLLGFFLVLICSKGIAGHNDGDSDLCPDIEISAGESITFQFTDYYTGKPYKSGDVIPLGTRMKHYQRGEVYGSCDISIWDYGKKTCINQRWERGINHLQGYMYYPTPPNVPNSVTPYKYFAGVSWDNCATKFDYHVLELGVTPCTQPGNLYFLSPGRYQISNDIIVNTTPCKIGPDYHIGPKVHFDVIDPKKSKCPKADARGNPCSTSTGNKHQREDDYTGPNLPFVRFYNSLFTADVGIGYGWMTPYHKRLAIGGLAIAGGAIGERVALLRSDGAGEEFKQQANGSFLGDADSEFTLVKTSDSYTLTDREGNAETYDERGLILSEADAAGNTTSYSYNTDEKLETVTGPFGHQLSFTYNATSKRVETVTLPDGQVLQFTYQLLSNDQAYNLVSVIYPDTTAKLYHYESTNLPHHLTGITDQNGVRFATWEYDAGGRAVRSEHAETTNAAPQESFLFSWDTALQTTVTDPRGNQEVFKFNFDNLGRKTLKEKLNLADTKKLLQTFDLRNNLTSRTDEEGSKTT